MIKSKTVAYKLSMCKRIYDLCKDGMNSDQIIEAIGLHRTSLRNYIFDLTYAGMLKSVKTKGVRLVTYYQIAEFDESRFAPKIAGTNHTKAHINPFIEHLTSYIEVKQGRLYNSDTYHTRGGVMPVNRGIASSFSMF